MRADQVVLVPERVEPPLGVGQVAEGPAGDRVGGERAVEPFGLALGRGVVRPPVGDAVRKVQANGEVDFRGRPWPVATCLRGLPVAVRPAAAAADGVMAVFFCSHEVARIDLRGDN